MNARDEFSSCWEKFAIKLKGCMLGMLTQRELTFGALTEMLDREREFWMSRYEEGGRWIEHLLEQDPARGEIVRNILTTDLHFSGSISAGVNLGMFRTLRVGIGMVVGFLLVSLSPDSWMMQSETLQNIRGLIPYLSAGCCGVAFYFLGLSFDASLVTKGQRDLIDSYLHQLDKFKLSVESVLSAEG